MDKKGYLTKMINSNTKMLVITNKYILKEKKSKHIQKLYTHI